MKPTSPVFIIIVVIILYTESSPSIRLRASFFFSRREIIFESGRKVYLTLHLIVFAKYQAPVEKAKHGRKQQAVITRKLYNEEEENTTTRKNARPSNETREGNDRVDDTKYNFSS